MTKNARELLALLNSDNKEVAEAAALGYVGGVIDCGYTLPAQPDPVSCARQQILREEVRRYERKRNEARAMLRHYGVDKVQFNCMMFDCMFMDAQGCEIGYDDKPVTNPGEHNPYDRSDLFHTDDGDIREVSYVELTDTEGHCYKVYKNEEDRPFIDELLTQTIAIGGPINDRYRKEAQPGGMLEEYGEVIMRALLEMKPLERSEVREISFESALESEQDC